MWMEFVRSFTPREDRTWAARHNWVNVEWFGAPPPPGTPVQIHEWAGRTSVLSSDGTLLGTVQDRLNPEREGLVLALVAQDVNNIHITYLGPNDLAVV